MRARRSRREYAEWLPELDLQVDGRWQRADLLASHEDVPVITRDFDATVEEDELDVSA